MSTAAPPPDSLRPPRNTRIAIAAARWNADIVDPLLAGCLARLRELGLSDRHIETHRVPGAFELPFAARLLANRKDLHAVICLGCVIRGDTPHFDYVAGECARGLMTINLTARLPVIFGVLTVNTHQQAQARIDPTTPHGHAGERAADAALEMLLLSRHARRPVRPNR